eukprot:CAMPEP_0114136154 /NCGR_PEP_ID=MMETSP0043_2-20121206/15057_1 /TAXON_ID=464988 /ORGANISM="Hemiselmis andersenii, Strain CCMP644" /LENGTH=276 /DNA_ID=CAMNT_0001229877 /DNA_START=108 /DNA_END=934 /DNA_ORIENTATION=-
MELLDKLSKVAKKVEKKTIIQLTGEEKRLLQEIEAQHAELEKLQAQFEDDLVESEDTFRPASFRYPKMDENADNMEIERLAELLKFEDFDNQWMVDACTTFVAEYASTVLQRVYRGHIGRRKFKVTKDIKWAIEAEKTAIIMQAAYRGMVGRRQARQYYKAKDDADRLVASVQVQRMVRGNLDRKMVKGMLQEVKAVDKAFFESKGLSEASLFRRRNNVANPDDSPSSSSSDSDDDEEYIPTRHPKTGKRLEAAPQYGEHLHETRHSYHHPHTRAP